MAGRRDAINDNERLLLEILEHEREVMKPRVSLGRYGGIADYLLREAEFFSLPDLNLSPFGMAQLCYANAFRIVRKSKGELQYAEGRALADMSFSLHGHAWCVDANDARR